MTSRCTEVLVLLLVLAGTARAHDTAMSSFEARPAAEGVQVVFRLDAQSVRDLTGFDDARLLAYVDARFAVTAGGPCPRAEPRALDVHADVVVLDVIYRCHGAVRMESTLFHDESIPHTVIGTIRAGGRADRYFFTRTERAVTVPMSPPPVGGFRMATPPDGAFSRAPAASARPVGTGFRAFFVSGIEHILGGLDHVLFVLTLLLAVDTWRRLALVITAFTIAHSLTLVLGALGLVVVSPALVEPLIALSIVLVAVENMVRRVPVARPGVVFGFGLVHGLGFSGVLAGLGFARADLAWPLLGFNLGVETGQLLIVAPLFPLALLLRRSRRAWLAVGGTIAVVAAFWFVDRLC